MATRVRKLAKQLRRPPVEVLGLLHAMGYVRYKSAQDMVGDDVVERLHSELRKGLEPLDLEVRAVPRKTVDKPSEPAKWDAPPPAVETPPSTPGDAAAKVELEQELDKLRADRDRLAGERSELQARLETLTTRLSRLEDAASRPDVAAATPEDGEATLVALLRGRGLLGEDEYERALGAMARERLLRDLLPALVVRDPARVEALLARRLLLMGGGVAEGVAAGTAVVTVAEERADLPSIDAIEAAVAGVGEQFLLSGLRRLTWVGGTPLWQRLVRGALDGRIQVRALPPIPRDATEARSDVAASDAVVLLGVDLDDDAREIYAASEVFLFRTDEASLLAVLQGLAAALRGG